ncbi:bone morphogenetic protein 7 [Onthophagus taurus]|uniref:bone morphogenetic protein 7 n=1 Tax=Onthophagus taurus TaxID=166361 RepID=UPI000C208D71|nr:bone morphogenetic protein 7 [Onthophagus taurus]
MGYHLWTRLTLWTYVCSVCATLSSPPPPGGPVEDLGLDHFPDVKKINVSQEEYTRMMTLYLDRLRSRIVQTELPKLLTFKSERKSWRRSRSGRIFFPIKADQGVDVESSELKMLAPPVPDTDLIHVRIYQILSTRRRRLVGENVFYPSNKDAKWFDIDVTSSTRSWLNGDRNLGLEVECVECSRGLKPLETSLNVLVVSKEVRRKRSLQQSGRERTDCRSNDSKKKCCRHRYTVTFKDLNMVEMNSIIQPKSYEASYCRGRCPVNYNHATNHSRIQSIIHKVNKTVPKVCCAPSKLEPLEILRVDPYDATKLYFEKWDNMKVLECACS